MKRLVLNAKWFRSELRHDARRTILDLFWLIPRTWFRWARYLPFENVSAIPVLFINLDHRQDRRNVFERHFPRFRLMNPIRISGVASEDGRIGAALAHQAALARAISEQWEAVIICEDDIELRVDPEKLHGVIAEFMGRKHLDVLCIGNRVKGVLFRLNDNLGIANNIQTASMYVVKKKALPLLVKSARESTDLLKRGIAQDISAVDAHWKVLQRGQLNFAVPYFRCVQQRPGYSDTAAKYTDYGV